MYSTLRRQHNCGRRCVCSDAFVEFCVGDTLLGVSLGLRCECLARISLIWHSSTPFQTAPLAARSFENMTEEEKCLTKEQGRYFHQYFAAGRVLLFGPEMASGGAFGDGVHQVENETQARPFGQARHR